MNNNSLQCVQPVVVLKEILFYIGMIYVVVAMQSYAEFIYRYLCCLIRVSVFLNIQGNCIS